mmetsp:Transcript_25609/g.56138  ORF Transcript_25609/g.56138 Transcript_25609/m.56138 type:complete len:251 (+) Transcript_25609:2177-2929(+)
MLPTSISASGAATGAASTATGVEVAAAEAAAEAAATLAAAAAAFAASFSAFSASFAACFSAFAAAFAASFSAFTRSFSTFAAAFSAAFSAAAFALASAWRRFCASCGVLPFSAISSLALFSPSFGTTICPYNSRLLLYFAANSSAFSVGKLMIMSVFSLLSLKYCRGSLSLFFKSCTMALIISRWAFFWTAKASLEPCSSYLFSTLCGVPSTSPRSTPRVYRIICRLPSMSKSGSIPWSRRSRFSCSSPS